MDDSDAEIARLGADLTVARAAAEVLKDDCEQLRIENADLRERLRNAEHVVACAAVVDRPVASACVGAPIGEALARAIAADRPLDAFAMSATFPFRRDA